MEFQALVQRTYAERHMPEASRAGAHAWPCSSARWVGHSLREICGGLARCEGKRSHLGMTAPSPLDAGLRPRASAYSLKISANCPATRWKASSISD
ncbi:MAG: hypothetical protein HZA23_00965 [Nitrospirae bacterium]|nr:hypothetical protein [Nitrospirota bacterium]